MSGKIYLIRHGETYWNNLGIMHGQFDIPLNNTGKTQARNVALTLINEHFDVCYCSPLQRAVFTAKEILNFHRDTPIYYDDRLMELYKGKLEGTHRDSEKLLITESLDLLIEYDVESKAHYFNRVKSFYDEILPQYKDKNILVVSHSGTVKMSMFYFNPPDNDIVTEWYNIHIPNCSVTTCENKIPDKLPKLITYNVDKEVYPYI